MIVENRVFPARDPVRRRMAMGGTSASVSCPDTIVSYFRDHFPVLLDGTLAERVPPGGDLVRKAQASLSRDPVEALRMPSEALREILDSLIADPAPATKAGLVAIGPHQARVWWDESVVENLDDVLMHLDSPRMILRFYDVTGLDPESGRWHAVVDIDIAVHERGRTVDLVGADRRYVVDLGYTYADGRFLRLARTGVADLPRDGCGRGDPAMTARSRLQSRDRQAEAVPASDTAATAWVGARSVAGKRDFRAELLVHLVYRAFLQEGPRALRRFPQLPYREESMVDTPVVSTASARALTIRENSAEKKANGFLVARLDVQQPPSAREMSYLPAPIPVVESLLWRRPLSSGGGYRWMRNLLALSRLRDDSRPKPVVALAQPEMTAIPRDASGEQGTDLVRPTRDAADDPSFLATPVFAAAEHLRRSLAGLHAVPGRLVVADGKKEKRSALLGTCGGAEAKRMAKAGVHISRMTLTLEGRMRPGARLKVGGRLVHADGDGCFRLECTLSGRRTSIPMRAGASVGGEARSLIQVEWEKRSTREKRKVH